MVVRSAYLGAALLVSVAAPSHADTFRGELGFAMGAHFFSEENGLGVPDAPDVTSQENSLLLGLRLGGYIAGWVGIEGEAGAVPSLVRDEDHSTMNLFYRLNAVLQFRATNPKNHLLPFVRGGVGGMSLVSAPGATMVSEETVTDFHVGAGLKYRASTGWGIRADALMLFPPSSQGGRAIDFELAVSLYTELGGGKREEPVAPVYRPYVASTPVGPTVTIDVTQNPNIDRDADNDGILDTNDSCRLDPEDTDGFQDTDGCPDLDNDGDRVVDYSDKCPTENETWNGFTDDDGCPDTQPEKVKQFTGKVEGISFKTGSADLLATSNKKLDQVVDVLKEYSQLKVEVGGHTDDVPLKASKKAKYQTNEELSQARAEAVKAYFVKKGIAADRITARGFGSSVPLDDPKGLTGAKLAAARAKNRRVEFKMN